VALPKCYRTLIPSVHSVTTIVGTSNESSFKLAIYGHKTA